MIKQQEKFIWADQLRTAAIVGVVTVHSAASIPPLFGQISGANWWTGHLIDCLARFCVPAFVMLSGALLLKTHSRPLDFYRRRFSRIVFPFLFWSLIYSLLQLAIKSGHLWQMSRSEYLSLFGKQLIQDSISYHFWYVYMILGLYLLIPVLGKWVRRMSGPALLGLSGLCFIGVFCADFFVEDLKVPDVLRYVGYLPLGYYLGNRQFKGNMQPLWLLLTLSGFLLTAVGTFWISSQHERFDASLYGYASPNILMYSVGVFMLFRNINWPIPSRVSAFISRYSYGIYLVHVLTLSQIKLKWFMQYPLLSIPLSVVLCMAVSGLIIFLLNRLPGGKYISG